MFDRTLGSAPAPMQVEPTSLLSLVAGEFALRVARLWASPHAEFLTAPVARRHLVCLAFTLGKDMSVAGPAILERRLPLALKAAVGDPPAGLARALARLGDLAWSMEGYRQLLTLLAEPKAAKVLRHAQKIEPSLVAHLAALPEPLAGAVRLASTLDAPQVDLLREAYDALRQREGAQADELASGWRRFDSAKALFAAVRHDLCPAPAPPPHPGGPRLRPLTTKAEFAQAARRYRNCLTDQTPYAASGWSAYYEWMGAPGAMVEITRDHIFGWRLDQARLAGNAPVPEQLREEIVDELVLMGVHVGRSGWELDRALAAFDGEWRPRPVDAVVAEVFGAE